MVTCRTGGRAIGRRADRDGRDDAVNREVDGRGAGAGCVRRGHDNGVRALARPVYACGLVQAAAAAASSLQVMLVGEFGCVNTTDVLVVFRNAPAAGERDRDTVRDRRATVKVVEPSRCCRLVGRRHRDGVAADCETRVCLPVVQRLLPPHRACRSWSSTEASVNA